MYAGSHLDIWEQIIRHVRRPLPLPNSGMDTLIGQDDLATCMQVSSTFNNITASILYDHAVADSTQRLFEGAAGLDTQRVHPNIRTKTENLHLIKHLYLEYHSMEVALPLKQLLLLPEKGLMTAEEGWELYGDEHLRGGKRSAMEETTTMFNEAFMVFRGGDENGIPIGQLESLALCSIRGEDPCWATPDAEVGMPLEFALMELFGVEELEPKIRQVQDMIPWVIVRLGVKDFCTRAAHEPLRLPAWSALPMPRDKEAVKDIRHKLAKAKERREERLSSPHRKLDIDGDGDDDIHAHGELNG